MAKQHALFQITSFVDSTNLNTFADKTKVTRNPRCGQWLRTAWEKKRSRFIGVSRHGIIVTSSSGGDFKAFSKEVHAFRRANDPQCRFPWG